MEEVWLDIESYPGYAVSNLGQIRNLRRNRIVKASPNKHGYMCVNLERDGKRRYIPVFRLVALAFCIDDYFDGAEATPRDGDRSNLRADNVKWVTNYEARRWNSGRGGDIVRQGVINQETGEIEWENPNRGHSLSSRRNKKLRSGVLNTETLEVDWE